MRLFYIILEYFSKTETYFSYDKFIKDPDRTNIGKESILLSKLQNEITWFDKYDGYKVLQISKKWFKIPKSNIRIHKDWINYKNKRRKE